MNSRISSIETSTPATPSRLLSESKNGLAILTIVMFEPPRSKYGSADEQAAGLFGAFVPFGQMVVVRRPARVAGVLCRSTQGIRHAVGIALVFKGFVNTVGFLGGHAVEQMTQERNRRLVGLVL